MTSDCGPQWNGWKGIDSNKATNGIIKSYEWQAVRYKPVNNIILGVGDVRRTNIKNVILLHTEADKYGYHMSSIC